MKIGGVCYCAVTKSVIAILRLQYARSIINRNNVTLKIALIVKCLRCCVAVLELNAYNSAFITE